MGWFSKKNQGKGGNTEPTIATTVANYVLAEDNVSPAASSRKNYVAPSPIIPPISPAQSSVQTKSMDTHGTEVEADEMVMVDRPVQNAATADDGYGDIENVESPSESRAAESEHERATDMRSSKQNHLNSLFNGHLMKWKFDAEEGTAFLRVPAFFGALGLTVTSIVALVMYPEAWEPKSIVMSICVVFMSLFILVLEGRFLSPSPLSARAHLRNIMTRNFNILRFVWGRGILYIIAGTINVAQTWLITIISGCVMIVLGILAIILGIHASRKFASLRNSLADESFLQLLFSYYDSDGDGYLEVNQFTALLSYLGMELDDRYALKAFDTIDRDGDRRISFDEFNHWWTSGYIERGRKTSPEYDHDDRP